MESIFGYVERITFQNPETGYTIGQIQEQGKTSLTCIVGFMPTLHPGVTVRCKGSWKNHLIYGKQFEVSEYQIEAPADLIGITKYLGSGLIRGIRGATAEKIIEKFGIETLNIIDQDPERLREVRGIGPKRIEMIKESWHNQRAIREVMIFLQTYGVSPAYAQKIFKSYKEQSIPRVKENPYCLAMDIAGIGFKTADAIAMKMGVSKDSPTRIDAGVEYSLSELSSDGHVCYPVNQFLEEAGKILEVSAELIQQRLEILFQAKRIQLLDLVQEGLLQPFIWLRALFSSELGIARELIRLKKSPDQLRKIEISKALDWVQKALNIQLAVNQQKAVESSLMEKLHVITGGPGTGKSTITKAILAIMDKLTDKILLAAPTGRAAKRMSEITGRKASTIHSLLEFDFMGGGFKRNRSKPLECDLIIVDEASMIDTHLMYSLLKAVPDHARLILVGDINQLPSVGPGNVLKDIIASKTISVTILNEIFRQAAGSRIITNAHKINQGQFPDLSNHREGDFFFIEAKEPEEILQQLVSLVGQRLPQRYGLNPFQEIQVLAPMKRGVIGIENLNVTLQQVLNPKGSPLLWRGMRFCKGDKVMQIRNNYQREVFNGDIGRIVDFDTDDQEMVVMMDDREVVYDFADLDELVLSYAVSIHKYQGSECPCVVIPTHPSHYMLLTRNLLYTGVTRGKRLVVLVGSKRAVGMAVNNDAVRKRYTGLQQALRDTALKGIP